MLVMPQPDTAFIDPFTELTFLLSALHEVEKLGR